MTVVRRLLVGAAAVAAVLVVWCAVVLVLVRSDLLDARERLEQARSATAEDLPADLAAAEQDLQQAVDRLDQPGPAVAAAVPGLGRPVDAVRAVARAGLSVETATSRVTAAATGGDPLVEGGAVDLDRLAAVAQELEAAAASTAGPVEGLVDQPSSWLPSPLGGPVTAAQGELHDAPERFARGAAGLTGLGGVLGADGPQRLLVMLQNNAELRATGGLVTVFAEAVAADGRLEVSAFRDVEDVADRSDAVRDVPAPPDYEALYGPLLADTTLWRNVNAHPDVPTSSQVLAEVAALSLEAPPDAVLWFDVPAIAELLAATGPVRLPDGSELTAGNAVDVLLSQAYRDAPDTFEGQAQRRAVLRGAADAVLGRLLSADDAGASPTALARALGAAAAGRHLAVWSADERAQAALREAGLAGAVDGSPGDLSAVAVHNLGGGDREGNKLDYYARRSVGVTAVVGADAAEVEQVVVLRNETPVAEELPAYVVGTGTPRQMHDLVDLALPRGAELVSFARGDALLDVEPVDRGDHAVVRDVVVLPPGTSVEWRLRYRVPVEDGRYALRLVPQPLAADAALEVRVLPAAGLRLALPVGSALQSTDDGVQLSGPFERELDLAVTAARESLPARAGAAVRRFWTEPVTLPGG